MSESGYPGSYPVGFLNWVRSQGWWGENRCHLCAGNVQDDDSVRVDIQKEIAEEKRQTWGKRTGQGASRRVTKTNATLIADARDTGLPAESFDWVGIDPPYSRHLAETLYGTEDVYSGMAAFVKEAWRLVKPGGMIMTFAYEPPPRPGVDAELIACWGIYQIPNVRNMTCLQVWKKPGHIVKGLERWYVE